MFTFSLQHNVTFAIIVAIISSFKQHSSFAFPLSRESREFRVGCDLHTLPGYAGWDFKGRVANAVCNGWCPADDLVLVPNSPSPSSCVPTATRTVFKFLKTATNQDGNIKQQPSKPWTNPLASPNDNVEASPTSNEDVQFTFKSAPTSDEIDHNIGSNAVQSTRNDGFNVEEHCNLAAERCMMIDVDAEACDAFKPCIELWMLAGRLNLLKVPIACGCSMPEEEEDQGKTNDCGDDWNCEKSDFTACRCFEPEESEDGYAGCAAQYDHTGDAVCGWNGDTEQCTGCPMLPENECKSSANPNCEWKITVCGVVDAASHTAPPFDSKGNTCV